MKNLKRSFSVVCDAPTPLQSAADPFAARINEANAMAQRGQHQKAADLYRQISREGSSFPYLWINLGISLVALERLEEAVEAFQEATRRNAEFAQAWNNLGSVLARLDRIDEAVVALCEAARLTPGDVDTLLNLARALHRQKSSSAIEIAGQATTLTPGRSDTWVALGDAHLAFGAPDKALLAYERALVLDSNCLSHSINLGLAYFNNSKLDEAELFFESYLAKKQDDAGAWGDFALVHATGGDLQVALDCFRRAIEIEHRAPAIHSNLLVIMSYGRDATPAAMRAEATEWARRNAPSGPRFPDPLPRKARTLRVGYVSGDFRSHPVGRFVSDIFREHDRAKFEVFAYSNCRAADAVTESIVGAVDHWRAVYDDTDEELAARIRNDNIDILIDLTGHTPMHRLPAFARRMAPVQATWLGYFGTTGLPAMDFILSDRILLPEDEEEFYFEKPAHMPNGLYFLQPPKQSIQPNPLPSLTRGYTTFGCFNMVTKITEESIALWARVLQALPESRMVLNRHAFTSKKVQERYFRLFEQHGIVRKRTDLRATRTREDYFRSFHDIDIVLDTLPFGGGTTSSEALWMGVPVVSLSSDRFPGRMTESILSTVGLTELIPRSEEEYVKLAVDLATDAARLSEYRRTLRSKVEASRLCDVTAYTREFESVLEWMWADRRR